MMGWMLLRLLWNVIGYRPVWRFLGKWWPFGREFAHHLIVRCYLPLGYSIDRRIKYWWRRKLKRRRFMRFMNRDLPQIAFDLAKTKGDG